MERLPGETEWVRKFQAGDPSAFVAIMNHYEPYILGLLTRLAGDRSKAEDLCQETFLKALKNLHRFRGDSSLKTWLFRIAHNAVSDAARAADPASQGVEELEEQGRPIPSSGADPLRKAEESQVRQAIGEAMNRLPQQQREVLHLFYWDELTVAEIAGAMRMPEGTVKTLLFRGRHALRGKVVSLVSEVAP